MIDYSKGIWKSLFHLIIYYINLFDCFVAIKIFQDLVKIDM